MSEIAMNRQYGEKCTIGFYKEVFDGIDIFGFCVISGKNEAEKYDKTIIWSLTDLGADFTFKNEKLAIKFFEDYLNAFAKIQYDIMTKYYPDFPDNSNIWLDDTMRYYNLDDWYHNV